MIRTYQILRWIAMGILILNDEDFIVLKFYRA